MLDATAVGEGVGDMAVGDGDGVTAGSVGVGLGVSVHVGTGVSTSNGVPLKTDPRSSIAPVGAVPLLSQVEPSGEA